MSYYKNYYSTDALFTKLAFFTFACLYLELVVKLLKSVSQKEALLFYTVFAVVSSC